MLFDFENDVEIAGRAIVGGGFAFAGDTQARAGIDARWNAQLDRFFAFDAALASAIGAAFFDDLSGALACGAGARDGEETLLVGELAATAAGLAGDDAGALLRAGAVAGFAIFLARKLDFCGDASGRFFEGKRHVITQIGAALLATAGAAAASTEKILEAEEIAENVVKIAEGGVV